MKTLNVWAIEKAIEDVLLNNRFASISDIEQKIKDIEIKSKKIIKNSKQINENDSIAIKFYDKTIGVNIKKIN